MTPGERARKLYLARLRARLRGEPEPARDDAPALAVVVAPEPPRAERFATLRAIDFAIAHVPTDHLEEVLATAQRLAAAR